MEMKKLNLRSMWENISYILRYTFRLEPKYYTFYIVLNFIIQAFDSVLVIMLYKYMIDSISLKRSFNETLFTIIFYGAVLGGISNVISVILRRYNDIRQTKVNGIVQRQIIKKAAKINLISYDKAEYYDSFVRAAERGDSEVVRCIEFIIYLTGSIASIVSLISIISIINPIMAIFPFMACIVNVIAGFNINRMKYAMSLEMDPIKRRKAYFTRVFYQVDYAKEMRLTEIKNPLFNMFNKAVEDEQKLAKKYGIKLLFVSIINSVIGLTGLVYYLPTSLLIYNSMISKKIKIGSLGALNEANSKTYNTLNGFAFQILELQKISLFAEQFREFMECRCEIEEATGEKLEEYEPKLIEIKNLSFRYEESGKNVLEDINITIKPKEKIAIVGHNGAGKSTFVKLLLHLYEASEGEVIYGGKNIKDYDIKDYRNQFGVIFQDFQVYAGTIGENIMMNRVNDEDQYLIKGYLDAYGISDGANEDRFGIDSQLTREFDDNGIVLSGGQNQKLAYLRLVAKKFGVAILDEPSSALDPMEEYKLNQNMFSASKDSTVIFISHRLSTTRMADKIYMFDNGRIIEEGTHDELMELDGQYAKMFKKQAHYYMSNNKNKTEDIQVS
ncbi:ABC transporter ATP-binding protein [Clostridium sp. C8-1-8]|uniref:ABC transporter ATP-binding protein n=1 Tax=Clostridium sp. C8-1-8 TaxID=2698831 RepID=UPI00136E4C00|nr:ABC transporter ATP-binding protein [Clostridium sp. C8-1-8]